MTSIIIEHHSPSELKPYTRNARTHSPKQIAEIARSIKAFGFNNPVLIDKDNGIVVGHVSGLGAVKHRELAMASGEMTEAEFTEFFGKVFNHLVEASVDGAIHFICMDWRHMGEVLAAARDRYAELKNLCVWAKTNGGMGRLYRSQHELVVVFKVGTSRVVRSAIRNGLHWMFVVRQLPIMRRIREADRVLSGPGHVTSGSVRTLMRAAASPSIQAGSWASEVSGCKMTTISTP